MTSTILAWHSDPALRDAAVQRMRLHAEADALIQQAYVTLDEEAPGGYRGCFYGCLVAEIDSRVLTDGDAEDEAYDDEFLAPRDPIGGWANAAARLLGLPPRFGRLAEALFEALPAAEAPAFAVALTEAIKPGTDLLKVVDRWLITLLADPEGGVRRVASGHGQPIIDRVVELLTLSAGGVRLDRDEWKLARGAASAHLDKRDGEPHFESAEWLDWQRQRAAVRTAQFAAEPVWEVSPACEAAADAYAIDDSAAAMHVGYRWQADQLIRLTADTAPAEVTG